MLYVKSPRPEGMVIVLVIRICLLLFEKAVPKFESSFTISRLAKVVTTFKNYKVALYATYVTFHGIKDSKMD